MDTVEIRQLNVESQKEVVTVILCALLNSLLDRLVQYRNHCIIGFKSAHCPNENSCLTLFAYLSVLWELISYITCMCCLTQKVGDGFSLFLTALILF